MQVEHHTKYKEIHGIDETIWMPKGEHRKLHNRLRKEGKCKISPDKLNEIAMVANKRTRKYIKRQQEYKKTHIKSLDFHTKLGYCVRLHEMIRCNLSSGNICFFTQFQTTNGRKIPVVEI